MNYRVLLFYKYVPVENPQAVVDEHLQWCLQNDIKGRVFIADEGINGTVSGTVGNIEKYKAQLGSYPGFEDIWFKEDEAEEHGGHALIQGFARFRRFVETDHADFCCCCGRLCGVP